MKKSELINLLSSSDEDEIYIKVGNDILPDIEVEHLEEEFDGFYTVLPAAIVLKPKEQE